MCPLLASEVISGGVCPFAFVEQAAASEWPEHKAAGRQTPRVPPMIQGLRRISTASNSAATLAEGHSGRPNRWRVP